MNRPLVIRQIVAHVANRRVTPYRLRTVDAVLLLAHIERLEANQRPAGGRGSSVALDPEERVLGDVVGEFAPPPAPGTHADDCALHPGHTGACTAFLSA